MRDHLREKVMVAIPHAEMMHSRFARCLLRLKDYDAKFGKRLSHDAWLCLTQSNNLASARNNAVIQFLESDKDWLWFVDTDQTFTPDILERMIASADPVERPILSALIQAKRDGDELSPACVGFDDSDPPVLRRSNTIPTAQHWPCIPGTGCVLIHRSVLVNVGAARHGEAFPWFEFAPWDRVIDGETVRTVMGEDYTFMLRANALGFTSWVDTTIEAGHLKTQELTSLDFFAQHPEAAQERWEAEREQWAAVPAATVAIIPFKNKWKLTLHAARSCDADLILLMNNGSDGDTTQAAHRYARSRPNVEVIDCKGQGIHEMWNAGAEIALERFPKVNLAFLNNDLEFDLPCLPILAESLRDGPADLVAVCPNYDGRECPGCAREEAGNYVGDLHGEPIEPLQGIAANRYDGTGGLAGFCFMVKGELFQQGYRFPEDCMWWFGDNDLTMTIDSLGGWYGMVHAATVKHLNGGGQTGDWDDYLSTPQGRADLAAFKAKWNLTEAAA